MMKRFISSKLTLLQLPNAKPDRHLAFPKWTDCEQQNFGVR